MDDFKRASQVIGFAIKLLGSVGFIWIDCTSGLLGKPVWPRVQFSRFSSRLVGPGLITMVKLSRVNSLCSFQLKSNLYQSL